MLHQKVNRKLEKLSKTIVELQMSWFEQDGRLFLATTQFDRFQNVVADVLHVIKPVVRQPHARPKQRTVCRPTQTTPKSKTANPTLFSNPSCPRCPLS